MLSSDYPLGVRTIEEVRLKNFQRLVKELTELLGHEPKPAEIASHLGISKVYAWQLQEGRRDTIESKAARKMEAELEKGFGWMDTDFELWPFPDIPPPRIEGLKPSQRIEIQGLVRDRIEKFEASNESAKKPLSDKRRA